MTLANNLLTKAQEFLGEIVLLTNSIELQAIDISNMDKNIDDFGFCEYVKVISVPHGFDDFLLIQKQSIDILNPVNNSITLGKTIKTFTRKAS